VNPDPRRSDEVVLGKALTGDADKEKKNGALTRPWEKPLIIPRES